MATIRDRLVRSFQQGKQRQVGANVTVPRRNVSRTPSRNRDSFGNVTNLKAGDVGTAVGRGGKWRVLGAKHRPHGSRDWG